MIRMLLSLIVYGLLCLPLRAELVNFSIDKEIFQSMDPSLQKMVAIKASELSEFFNQQVYPKIPSEIKNRLGELSVTISFQNKSARDGLFLPGENHQHKILISLLQLNSNGLKALVAHEFYHAIHFEINPDEEPWIREGMAQLFEYITTNELSGSNLQAAIANPFTPLIGIYDINRPNPAQYGHNLLYFYYLFNHCGKENLFWKLTAGDEGKKGSELINSTLKDISSQAVECRDFYSSALSFEAAKVHNQIQFSNKNGSERFFLAPTNLPVKPTVFETKQQLIQTVKNMPVWSSLRLGLDDWRSVSLKVPGVKVFYARKTFPFEISEEMSAKVSKYTDVILVKTDSAD